MKIASQEIEEQIRKDKKAFDLLPKYKQEYLKREVEYMRKFPYDHEGFNYNSWNLV